MPRFLLSTLDSPLGKIVAECSSVLFMSMLPCTGNSSLSFPQNTCCYTLLVLKCVWRNEYSREEKSNVPQQVDLQAWFQHTCIHTCARSQPETRTPLVYVCPKHTTHLEILCIHQGSCFLCECVDTCEILLTFHVFVVDLWIGFCERCCVCVLVYSRM